MKIMSAIQVKLTTGELARITARGTNNREAYIKVMQGQEYFFRRNKEGNIEARKFFEEAITLDQEYPMAYASLGQTRAWDVLLGLSKSRRKSLQEAVKLYQKALAIDESHPIANIALAQAYAYQRQFEKSLAQAERAVALNPNMARPNAQLGVALFRLGRYEEAIQSLDKAIRLDPKGPGHYFLWLGEAYCFAGQYEEAIAELKKAIGRVPNSAMFRVALAAIYSMAGREEEARAEVAEVLRLDPKFSLGYYGKVMPLRKAELEQWLEALRKAGLPESPPLPLPDKPSIAVLPFVNMSGDPKQEYFSDGISEEIITALSKTPKMFVIARNSTFTYKGKPVKVQQVGRELGVKYVLEGSVRKSEEKVRITAQLVDAQTGHHLWAERYDRDLKEIFALQDEITMKIVTALRVRLTAGEAARMSAKRTDNLEAYLWRLQAGEQIIRMNREGVFLARQMAEKAIELDPKYGEAYYILASTYWLELPLRLTKDPRQSIARAMDLTQNAISLDKSFASARSLLGMIYVLRRQHDKGILECERAISLEPNSAWAHYFLGNALRFAGKQREAIVNLKAAIRLDPIPPSSFYGTLANSYCLAGQYEEAIRVGKQATLRGPDNLFAHAFLAAAYSLQGRKEEAGIEAREVFRISPKFSLEHWAKAIPYKNKADRDLIIGAMRKAGLK
jgi:TolB-like protein/Flp pilus assembly protein TadD